MKRVLMIAFHFPPLAGSSGIQRTLRFARYLPDFGWEPTILTAHPRAYERTSDDLVNDVPSGVRVIRAQAWDSARHFSVAGRYPAVLSRPDRWLSWMLGAVPAGLRAIQALHPLAIWSTYPIATAHRIGGLLSTQSGLPWLADFRDPMVQDDYPPNLATKQSFARIERDTVSRAHFSTFTTPSAVSTYQSRYPEHADRCVLLENGYDEEVFSGVQVGEALCPGKLTLLHSGIVYPSERNPIHIFTALAHLRATAPEIYVRIKLRFRAPVHTDLLHRLALQNQVEDAIEILPPIGYRDALNEMVQADGLLILQASNCNAQIPAKFYEYIRARRPVLALTDPVGDTALVAHRAGITAIAPLNDSTAIASLFTRFTLSPRQGTISTEAAIAEASRRGRTAALAGLLERATAFGT